MVSFNRSFLLLFVLSGLLPAAGVRGQEPTAGSTQQQQLLANIYTSLSCKAESLEQAFDKQTATYLARLQRQEGKLKAKLQKRDSVLARQLFEVVEEKYAALKNAPQQLSRYSQAYSGRLDSLTTALNFLRSEKLNLPAGELEKTLSGFSLLQDKLNQSENIRRFLSERKRLLQENLGRLGLLKSLRGFQKQAYYYSQQVRELKALWEDPSKLEEKLLQLVGQHPRFAGFFAGHSVLGSLFALPGSGGNTATPSLAGLQTRAAVQQGIQDRFGSGPQVRQMIEQQVQAAQGQLSELKNKLSQYGSGTYGNTSSDIDMPEGFRANGQKTKTFLQRLEYGLNVQSQKAGGYFPTTSDLGLSLGYKLSDRGSIGVGASYKLGWGRGWNHIRLTHEGVGLRSYVDLKLKGSLFVSGGYEQNHRTAFQNVQQLKDYSSWQSSGLMGVSKKYNVSKKLKGDVKLLWDFLSYGQVPRTQAILFRVGYNIK